MSKTTPEPKQRGCLARILRAALLIVLLLIIALAGAFFALNEPRPEGTTGPEAEALADKVLAAINDKAWDETGAVSWTFARGHEHLWDRTRGYARVSWDNTTVLLRLKDRSGSATRNGQALRGDDLNKALQDAWKMWANDSFWLNPVSKIDDPGTTRSIVALPDGSKGLLISYSSGGVTPGDSYLWILGPDHTPTAWKMWVNIIPIGGVHATWEDWKTLKTGVRISPKHDLGIAVLELKDIQAAKTLSELTKGDDPFKTLGGSPLDAPTSEPTSKPPQ